MDKLKQQAGGEFIRHLEASGWAPVPRRAMDDTNLSIESRGALAWLLTRPDGHRLFVRYAQQRLGISQARWQRLRRELEAAGYLHVEKSRNQQGGYVWHYHIFDSPKSENPVSIGDSSIGRFSTDGLSTGGKPTDKERHPEERNEKERHNASLRDALRGKSQKAQKLKDKNITPPLTADAVKKKAKASPKPVDIFRDELEAFPDFQEWLKSQEDRPPSAYWMRTHVLPNLRAVHAGGGWDGVREALSQAIAGGYRGFAHVGGVLPCAGSTGARSRSSVSQQANQRRPRTGTTCGLAAPRATSSQPNTSTCRAGLIGRKSTGRTLTSTSGPTDRSPAGRS